MKKDTPSPFHPPHTNKTNNNTHPTTKTKNYSIPYQLKTALPGARTET